MNQSDFDISSKGILKRITYNLIGDSDYSKLASAYFDITDQLLWTTSIKRYRSNLRLYKFKNKYKGKRCFIIGNGPSLNNMDLSLLKNEITFGLNRIYLLFEKIGFSTTFYVSVNSLVIKQFSDDITNLPMTKFISWHSREHINFSENIVYIRNPIKKSLNFSKNPCNEIWDGATVTYVALQLAYYFGFNEVILIGIDHNFKTKGRPHQKILSHGPDFNHFDPNYFGKGYQWHLPDLETSEKAYSIAKKIFEQDGRRIIDSTVGGCLNIFPKVDFTTIIQ